MLTILKTAKRSLLEVSSTASTQNYNQSYYFNSENFVDKPEKMSCLNLKKKNIYFIKLILKMKNIS